jgi:Satellite tobacco necrosis virus coat protein.
MPTKVHYTPHPPYTRRPKGMFTRNRHKVAKICRRIINSQAEHKFLDVTNDPSPTHPTSGGVIIELNNVPQGDTMSSRDGAQIRCTGGYFGVTILPHASSTYPTICTFWIIQDRAPTGTPSCATVLQADSRTLWQPLMPLLYTSRQRFKVLKHFHMQVTLTDQHPIVRQMHYRIKGPTIWDVSNAAIMKGAIYLVYTSNDDTHTPEVMYYSRITYTDL